MEQRKKTCVAHGLLEFVTSKKKRSPSFNNAMTFAPAHTLTPTSARTQISARRRFAYLSISTALGWLSVHAVYRSMRDGGQTAAVPENRPGWGGGGRVGSDGVRARTTGAATTGGPPGPAEIVAGSG